MSNQPSAIIFAGGWAGHEPELTAQRFSAALEDRGYTVQIVDTLEPLDAPDFLPQFDLIIPMWTMGGPSKATLNNLRKAVKAGSGLAGFHGGMGDTFRGELGFQEMVGGHFIHHDHVGDYVVEVTQPEHEAMQALPATFTYNSEQYYMMVDPGIQSLATTTYRVEDRSITMPVVWTHSFKGTRVFYSALGHKDAEFDSYPHVFQMTLNGMLWATRK